MLAHLPDGNVQNMSLQDMEYIKPSPVRELRREGSTGMEDMERQWGEEWVHVALLLLHLAEVTV